VMERTGRDQQVPGQTRRAVGTGLGKQAAMNISSGDRAPDRINVLGYVDLTESRVRVF
jgi:hypothetical protein